LAAANRRVSVVLCSTKERYPNEGKWLQASLRHERGGLIREVHMNTSKNDGQSGLARGALLWMIGIPIPIILLLWLFGFDM
jgi:hypothetical protein